MKSYLGIDVGGTKVALRLAAADGSTTAATTFEWPPAGGGTVGDADDDIARLRAEVTAFLAGADGAADLAAVGVAVPATVDRRGVVTAWPNRPAWVGLDLGAALRALAPGAEVRWADDGDLAALAEADAAGCDHLVHLGVGTGVGGGIVLGGRLWPGPERGSCEVGHVVVDRAGPRCDCGRRGCLQAVASGPATLRRAAAARGRAVLPADLRAGVAAGEAWAVGAVDETAAALASAATSLTELVRPDAITIGGGFAAAVPELVPLVDRHLPSLSRPGHPPAPVRPAALGALSSLDGAVLLARGAGRSSATTS